MIYDFKVTVDGTDYENIRFPSIRVTGRENGVASAILIAQNTYSGFYPDNVSKFDSIQIYVKKHSAAAYTEIFDGIIRDCIPTLAKESVVTLKCKGLGQALLETHCNRSYGSQSDNPTLDTVEEILEDLTDNMINKSYGSANNTGYALTKTYIPTIDAALSMVYFNLPYQSNKELFDRVLTVDTAYRDGSTAGPHYFVDVAGNIRVKTISDQQAGAGAIPDWGNYCGGSAVAVSLYEGIDFKHYTLTEPTDEYANNIVLATDLRKPPYDFWTEGEVPGSWGTENIDALTADATCVVGTVSMKIAFALTPGEVYYPSTEDAGWDVTTWGSEKTIPRLNFYYRDHGAASLTTIYMFTSDHNGVDSYTLNPLYGFAGFTQDTWYHISLPIGPYWASAEESKQFRWTKAGNGDWADIKGISFQGTRLLAGNVTYIDDLHFSGKIVREAVDTSEVTDHDEHQKVFISRTALDDSCKAADDTGMAGYYAYAELLRRVNIPRTITFTIPMRPELLPGEYFKIYAGKTLAGTYKINGVDFRTLQYTHSIGMAEGFITTVSATDDLLNSFPINPVDTKTILNEYLLINNAKATDMKGGDVDLLIPHMRKTY